MKKLSTLLTVLTTILGTTVTTYAATPLYKPLSEYGYTGVPDIDKDDLSEDTNKMIENAVEIYFKEHPIVLNIKKYGKR